MHPRYNPPRPRVVDAVVGGVEALRLLLTNLLQQSGGAATAASPLISEAGYGSRRRSQQIVRAIEKLYEVQDLLLE